MLRDVFNDRLQAQFDKLTNFVVCFAMNSWHHLSARVSKAATASSSSNHSLSRKVYLLQDFIVIYFWFPKRKTEFFLILFNHNANEIQLIVIPWW